MSLAGKAYENLILNLYPESPLPFCWQVIYQEAIRGNHLIFSKNDIAGFQLESAENLHLELKQCGDQVVDCITSLMVMTNLNQIRSLITDLDASTKRCLFSVYQRIIKNWMIQHRNLMN